MTGVVGDESDVGDDATILVRLLDYPLAIGQQSSQHYEEVMREFALLVATGRVQPGSAQERVLTLVAALGERRARNNELEMLRSAALSRGETSADFELLVPSSVVEPSCELDARLDEADDLCRRGEVLALPPAARVVAFRRWYLAELIRQVGGGDPVAWSGEQA